MVECNLSPLRSHGSHSLMVPFLAFQMVKFTACLCQMMLAAIDNWLFLMQSDGGCSLMNPFSKATLNLPKLATCWHHERYNAGSRLKPLYYKLVVPSPLDSSPDSLVAVLIMDDGNYTTLFICQPPVATDSSRRREPLEHLSDFTFFDGKLYALAMFGGLVTLEISGSSERKPKILATNFVIDSRDPINGAPEHLPNEVVYVFREYLVECVGRLLVVQRYIRMMAHASGHDFFEHDKTVGYKVFEADLSSRPGRWRRVSKLGGQALFVGKHCSKAFPAGEPGGAQEDCIYFICDYQPLKFAANPLRDSGMYNLRNGMITPSLSGTAAAPPHRVGHSCPTWFFPMEAM